MKCLENHSIFLFVLLLVNVYVPVLAAPANQESPDQIIEADAPVEYKKEQPMLAIAVLSGPKNVTGVVRLEQKSPDSPTTIRYNITGNDPNTKRGFHIHTYSVDQTGCISAGSHYNPFGKNHGSSSDNERHVGDLGNIDIDAEGKSIGQTTDSQVQLFGKNSVIGRSVVVHDGTDDLGKGKTPDSLKTGNAGGRIACGVIGLAPQ